MLNVVVQNKPQNDVLAQSVMTLCSSPRIVVRDHDFDRLSLRISSCQFVDAAIVLVPVYGERKCGLRRCRYIGLPRSEAFGTRRLPKRMKPSEMSSLKCSCCETKIEPTTVMGVLARSPNEAAGLDDHEDGR